MSHQCLAIYLYIYLADWNLTQVLVLARQVLCPLSHTPSFFFFFFLVWLFFGKSITLFAQDRPGP
jgi:hypothetical protein